MNWLNLLVGLFVLGGVAYMSYWVGFREGLRTTIKIVEEEERG